MDRAYGRRAGDGTGKRLRLGGNSALALCATGITTGSLPAMGPIVTTEMHTGGEPVRIVESGYPPILGATILDKRRYVRSELDHLRSFLMLEPRGHDDMYGVLMVEPDLPEADLAVLFMHNEGYSTMCGHATIAIGKYAVARGLVEVREPTTHFVLQCPCGPVQVSVDVDGGRPGRTRFRSVPAFATALDQEAQVPGFGTIPYDLAYGGAFYAFADAAAFGLDVRTSPVRRLVDAATGLTAAVRSHPAVIHPDGPDLAFLYGTILTDGGDGSPESGPSANVCVFADAQVDRSPTGSGVTGRMALVAARRGARRGRVHTFESIVGSTMTGAVVEELAGGEHPVVTVEVAGEAHFTGTAEFTVEPSDPLANGFRLR